MTFNCTMKGIIHAILSKSLSPTLPPLPCSFHWLFWMSGCTCTVLLSPHTILENRHHYNYSHLRAEATEAQSGTQYKMPDFYWNLGLFGSKTSFQPSCWYHHTIVTSIVVRVSIAVILYSSITRSPSITYLITSNNITRIKMIANVDVINIITAIIISV